jgi:hypothetical protein
VGLSGREEHRPQHQVAGETERILRLKNGRIEKEKQGNLAKRKLDRNWRSNGVATEIDASKFDVDVDERVEDDD